MSRNRSVAIVGGYSLAVVICAAVAYWRLPLWGAYHRLPAASKGAAPLRLRVAAIGDDGTRYACRVDGLEPGKRYRVVLARSTRLPRPGALAMGQMFVGRARVDGPQDEVTAIAPERDRQVVFLAAVALLLLGVAAGVQGVRVAAAVVLAMALVGFGLVPLSLRGWNPVLLVVPLSCVLVAVTLPLISGWNAKSRVAIVSSLCGLFVAAALALWCCHWLKFVGMDIEFGPNFHLGTQYWYNRALIGVRFDYLLVAAMVLSSLGVVIDVSMDVGAAVAELKARAPHLSRGQLAAAGTRVGHDVMCMMAMTIAFVSIGGELDYFVSLSQIGTWRTWVEVLNFEGVAVEVARLVVCGIGMLVAMTLAAVVAGWHFSRGGADDPAALAGHGRDLLPARPSLERLASLVAGAGIIAVASLWLAHAAPFEPGDRADESRALVRVLELEPPVVDPQLQVVDQTGDTQRRREEVMRTRAVGVEAITGPEAGRRMALTLLVHPNPAANVRLSKAAVVRAQLLRAGDGRLSDVMLTKPLLRCRQLPLLVGAFLVALLVVGGVRGARLAWATIAVAALTLVVYLPALCRGLHAATVTAGFAAGAMVLTFAMTDRFSRKTAAAFVGVMVPVVVVGIVGVACVDLLGFSGEHSTSAVVMRERAGQVVDLKGLLSASMIVVVIGVAIDMAMSLAAAVNVLYEAKPDLSPRAAFASGMVVSRDITGTMLVTMFFVYLGVRLPVLFFPTVAGISVAETVNGEPGSLEIVRLLVGAIGLVLTGPATVAAAVAARKWLPERPRPANPARPGRLGRWGLAAGLTVVLVALLVGFSRSKHNEGRLLAEGRARHTLDQRVRRTTDVDELIGLAHEWATEPDKADAATFAAWRARKLAPRRPDAHVAVGYVYAHRRWTPNALQAFERALESGPKNQAALYYAGHVCLVLGRPREAVTHLLKAVKSSPDSVDVLYELATALTHAREWNAAEHYALKAYYLAPDDARILTLIDSIGVDGKRLEAAKKAIERKQQTP